MDTNEKSGAGRTGQPEPGKQPGNPPVQQRPTGSRAPKMDGVSAGGRPQRPVPRSAPRPGTRPQPNQEAVPARHETEETRPVTSQRSAAPQQPERASAPEAAPQPRQSQGAEGQAVQRPRRAAQEKDASQRPQRAAQADGSQHPQRAAQAQNGAQPQRRPSQGRRTEAKPTGKAGDAARKPPRNTAPAGGQKKKVKRDPDGGRSDSGYQPYRRANEKRKAQRASNLRIFFSDQNPVLKWFERVRYNKDSFAEDSDLAKKRRAQRAEEEEKRRRRQSRFNTPAVIYTQPAAFNRDRLILQLISVLTVVVALMVGLSLFFKVGRITVSGAEVYDPWAIVEASGVSKGENLLTLSRARATSQILANLPYVKKVRIGIKLPDTVNIEIEESNVTYAIKDDQGTWWLMDSDAKVTEMINNSVASNYTQILGVTLSAPRVGDIGVATEAQAEEVTETQPGEETLPTVAPVVVTGAERLAVTLQILKALETNGIVGDAASVDVSDVEELELWYGSRYQVMLGDSNDLDNKIACMYDAILQMSDYQTGILDVSFTTWETQVALTPFE